MRVWRAVAYLLGAAVSVAALPLLVSPALQQPWAQWHRRRAARLRGVPEQSHPVPSRRFAGWLPAHVALAVVAAALLVMCLGNGLVGAVVAVFWWAFPAGDPPRLFVEVPVTSWGAAVALGAAQAGLAAALAYVTFPRLAAAHARVTLHMLAPSAADLLAARVAVLTRTRADVLKAHGAELRRIERDLHDGTQARLVAIAMRLGVARQVLASDPQLAERVLREAHEATEEAMTELRGVIRSVYPPILADLGLAGALRTATARGGLPTELHVGELGRVPAAVEAVAYFAVIEALTNAAKHSGAAKACVSVHRTGDRLSIVVLDDGAGGADESRGTGLAGIRRRAEALDGTVAVASPPGGPTRLTVELPCGW